MRPDTLIVCDTRDQAHNLHRWHPDFDVAVVGDALYGARYKRIIDARYILRSGDDFTRAAAWWDQHARCRLEPGGTLEIWA